MDLDFVRDRLSELRDDELLRQALLHPGDLRPGVKGVLAEILAERLGSFAELSAREVRRTGDLVARLLDVRGFSRLRAPGEPVLGGPDVPPHDGVIVLATGGMGFLPTSASPDTVFRDFSPDAMSGSIAEWLGTEGIRWPPNVPRGGTRPLPLPLRARLDPAAAWVDRACMTELSLGRRRWRLRAESVADAVFRLVGTADRQALQAWASRVELPVSSGRGGGA